MIRVVLILGLVIGCRTGAPWPPAPVEVALGEDACASCRMLVSDARFGAQLHIRGGDARHFDDLGCWRKAIEGTRPDPVASFVRSYPDGAWIRGDRAFAVRTGELHSPMGSGLATFATREAAANFAERHAGATVLTWKELIQ